MKKLIAILALAFTIPAFATLNQWYTGTAPKGQSIVASDAGYFAFMPMDVKVDTNQIVYSDPIDLLKVPINYRDTGTGDAALLPDYSMGAVMISCFDVYDSASVTDTVKVSLQPQVSQYAGDNIFPNANQGEQGGPSDTWASLGSAITIDAASDAKAVVEGTATAITLTSPLDRFVRFKLTNSKTTFKNTPRCRVYWARKSFKR